MALNGGQLFKTFRFPRAKLQVKIYTAYDIINSAPLNTYDYLINPANEALVGTRFAYFPVGGPVPKLPSYLKQTTSSVLLHESSTSSSSELFMRSSTWGGMDAGENLLYSVQVVDGEVHEQCGTPLLNYLQALPVLRKDEAGQDVRCPVGTAVFSPSFGSFMNYFRNIIHTVAPFYSDDNWEQLLKSCYMKSFDIAFRNGQMSKEERNHTEGITIASVVLGAGCRGIPFNKAAMAAAEACGEYSECTNTGDGLHENISGDHQLHFILREEEHTSILSQYIEDCTNAEIISSS